MFDWLRQLFGGKKEEKQSVPAAQKSQSATQPPAAQPEHESTIPARRQPVSQPVGGSEPAEGSGQEHLAKLHAKVNSLADQFATGRINQKQFQELYDHYQNDISMLEQFLAQNPNAGDWKSSISDGKSVIIRRRYSAKLLGFAIYDRTSGMPLRTFGEFGVDPALFVPMMFAYQSATQEIFGGGMQSTQIEGGQWLCFAPGKFTATIALLSAEPSQRQRSKLEELQGLFEKANRNRLDSPDLDPDTLVCPHQFFIEHPF